MTESDAVRRYRALVHALAWNEPDRETANQLADLYCVLGIDADWAADDIERLLRGEELKPLPELNE
jgi:hypothetical protein